MIKLQPTVNSGVRIFLNFLNVPKGNIIWQTGTFLQPPQEFSTRAKGRPTDLSVLHKRRYHSIVQTQNMNEFTYGTGYPRLSPK